MGAEWAISGAEGLRNGSVLSLKWKKKQLIDGEIGNDEDNELERVK